MSKPMQWNEGFFDDLGTGSAADSIVGSVAERCAAEARASAPVDTGAYRDGIVVSKRRSGHRTVHVVTATDPKSTLIESYTGNLARAMNRAAGG